MSNRNKNIERLRMEQEAFEKANRMVMNQLKQYASLDSKIEPKALKWSKSLASHICDEIINELKTHHQSQTHGIERVDFWLLVKSNIKSV